MKEKRAKSPRAGDLEVSSGTTADAAVYELILNVLGYKEEGEWVALALEMDLRGYGSTFQAAVGELMDLVRMQVSFAHSKGQPEMVWKSAEGHWWSLFGQIRRERLEAILRAGSSFGEEDYGIAGIKIPRELTQRGSWAA